MGRPYAEVIGDPIAHSKSPLIHNFWLAKLGIDAEYRACHVREEELADYFAQRPKDAEWRGCNVTMPHKQAVLPLIDRLDSKAKLIGAVNTIVPDASGHLVGYNTDVDGFLEPLMPLLAERKVGRVSIIGTGGAARAVLSAFSMFADKGDESGSEMTIVLAGRHQDRALSLLKELLHAVANDASATSIDEFRLLLSERGGTATRSGPAKGDKAAIADIVVNASALGMVGKPSLDLELSSLPENSIVYDIVTHPIDTELLSQARRNGLRTIDGFAMLIGQAAAAFEKFFGQPAPREYDAELRALLTA